MDAIAGRALHIPAGLKKTGRVRFNERVAFNVATRVCAAIETTCRTAYSIYHPVLSVNQKIEPTPQDETRFREWQFRTAKTPPPGAASGSETRETLHVRCHCLAVRPPMDSSQRDEGYYRFRSHLQ
jgi:hypothetical protein